MPVDHLKGPVKGVKSFDKVCSHLLCTQDFLHYVDQISKNLDVATVTGWFFAAGGDDYADKPSEKKNVAPPVWRLTVNWGLKDAETVYGPSDINRWAVSIVRISDEETLNRIATKNFGDPKVCPTYNCKLDKLLGKEDTKKSQENLWVNAARRQIEEKLADKISHTQDRLRKIMNSMINSPEFEQERTSFHERGIADEIKKVLLKFSSVAKPHVIKMAMDEFVCHEIMES